MTKKLLNKILKVFSYDYDKRKIENYLANSNDMYDLDSRQKELERKGTYNRFYI